MKVYYLRVSTIEQNTARQMEEIPEGCKVFEDKISGSVPFAERTEGRNIVNLIKQRQINTIHVHSIDRLGRNSLDILQTIQFFNEYEVNLISKKEGLQTFIDGKKNEIASLMIGILSTLSEFELTRIKERQREGISSAKERGAYASNGGTKRAESFDEFMNKESSKKILKYLKQGLSVRSCAKMSECSISLVMKVRGLLVESETLKSTKVIEVPVITKPKQAKDEVKLKEYLKENLEEETEEERAEWVRMEREQNKGM
jgi:DNA invertase Pin-like site-specific DNA recombinase